jgi:broad specificity phosphatase PhoE
VSARVTLISAAASAATRAVSFPLDDSLDDAARLAILTTTLRFDARSIALTSPALAAQETAAVLGLSAGVDSALADLDYGAWAGQSLEAIFRQHSSAAESWRSDPRAAPHGGESIAELAERAASWLASRTEGGRLIAVTHPAVIRAMARPLHTTELTSNGKRWVIGALNVPMS